MIDLALVAAAIGLILVLSEVGRNGIMSLRGHIMGATAFYVLPAIASFGRSGGAHLGYNEVGAVVIIMTLFALLCSLALYLGLGDATRIDSAARGLVFEAREASVFVVGGGFLVLVSVVAQIFMVSQGGVIAYYQDAQFYSLELRGSVVWGIALSRWGYVGMAMAAMVPLHYARKGILAIMVTGSVLPLAGIIFLFRRSDVIYLVVPWYILVSKYDGTWGRKRVGATVLVLLGRAVGVAMAAALVFLMSNVTALRQARISGVGAAEAILSGTDDRFAQPDALGVESAIVAAQFAVDYMDGRALLWGSSYYNALIDNFLPASLVGTEFKEDLRWRNEGNDGPSFVRSSMYYIAPFGFSHALANFGAFCWLPFLVLGLIIRQAIRSGRPALVLAGSSCWPHLLFSVVADSVTTVPRLLHLSLALGLGYVVGATFSGLFVGRAGGRRETTRRLEL